MELKEFIASGIIESYLLGTATSNEVEMVHSMLKKYPELEDEITAIELALITASSNSKPVNADLKNRIFESIDFTPKQTSGPAENMVPFSSSKTTGRWTRYVVAASVVALIASLLLNVMLYMNMNRASNDMARLNDQNIKMQSELASQNSSISQMKDQMAVMTDTSNQKITLKGLTPQPDALATVYWNPEKNNVHLYVNNLIPAPDGKQYQLWAIVDGKPVDAGVFDCAKGVGLQNMKNISNAQAFAVTLEKAGGSPTPTLEAMYLIGNV